MGQMTSADCKKRCGTSLLQLQHSHQCDWQDWLPRHVKLTLHGAWRWTWQICRWTWVDRIGKTGRYLQLRNFAFAPHKIYLGPFRLRPFTLVAVPKLWFLCSCLFCKDLVSNGPNDKHRLQEEVWHLVFTTSTLAPVQLARLGWLPRHVKLTLHSALRRTWQMCHWPCNVKSPIDKPSIPNTNLDRIGKTGRYLQLRSFTVFALHSLYLGPVQDPAS